MVEHYIFNFFNIYRYIMVAYFLLSWLPSGQDSTIGRLLASVVEPYVSQFRRIIPPVGFIDLSSLVALFATYPISFGVVAIVNLIAG